MTKHHFYHVPLWTTVIYSESILNKGLIMATTSVVFPWVMQVKSTKTVMLLQPPQGCGGAIGGFQDTAGFDLGEVCSSWILQSAENKGFSSSPTTNCYVSDINRDPKSFHWNDSNI